MSRRLARTALAALAALLFCASTGWAQFRNGPVMLDKAPEGLAQPVSWVGNKALDREILPPPLIDAVDKLLKAGGSVLIMGHTDAVGPRALNHSLGLQYSVNAAHRLAAKLGAEPWRFGCISLGEKGGKEESGIEVYAWNQPEPPPPPAPSPVQILSPPPESGVSTRLWAVWDNDARGMLWTRVEGDHIITWQMDLTNPEVDLPYPALSSNSALGAVFDDGRSFVEGQWREPEPDPRLMLSVESLEAGWARLAGKAPEGSSDVVVWAGGIPYPAPVEFGRFEVSVARYLPEMRTYAQATDAKGHAIVGPVVELPASLEGSPKMLVVLTWKGSDVNLDLHGWSPSGHTHPQDPDPKMSRSAAKGVKLLFDGNGRSRAAALWVDDLEDLQVEARTFTDLGDGGEALMYVVFDPGDPVIRRGRILGPRVMSGQPRQSRWPALSLRGE